MALKMAKRTRIMPNTRQLEDVPELVHRIQVLLPAKEAARTCILSKSWLHAWSTISTLRFSLGRRTDETVRNYKMMIDHTLQRYHRDNTPIEILDLEVYVKNQEFSPFVANNWIQPIVSKTCLKSLSLKIWVLNDSFRLPNELFSSEALNTINVSAADSMMTNLLGICSNPCIKCVFLHVLDLRFLSISEEVLSNLLSTCTLLEKINLCHCKGLKNVMVKNLLRLCELGIVSVEENDLWEISNVPSLRTFSYRSVYGCWDDDPLPFKIDSLATLTQLSIDGVIIDNNFLDIIKSKCILLENLTLGIRNWGLQSLVITSASLKSLTLDLWEYGRQVNVQVYAPKLLSFVYTGEAHGLFFPINSPKNIKLTYYLKRPLDQSFFLKLGEVVNSSSKFDIDIKERNPEVPLNIDLDCLRRGGWFPVTNVHELWLKKSSDEHMWENKRFFDAFFSIFHPSYIKSSVLVVREMMERRAIDLKDVQFKNPCNGKWETLTSSGVLDALTDWNSVECKLDWFSV